MERTVDQSIISDFETLVDELVKTQPDEQQVKFLMEKLGMDYNIEPVKRISVVLEQMNNRVFESKERRLKNDLQEHSLYCW